MGKTTTSEVMDFQASMSNLASRIIMALVCVWVGVGVPWLKILRRQKRFAFAVSTTVGGCHDHR